MFPLIREISLRHFIRTPVRSLLVVFGIALGVAVFVAAQATSQSILDSFDELVTRVAGRADLTVLGNQAGVDGALVAQIAEIDGVAHTAATLETMASFADDQQPLMILGLDFLGDTYFLPFQAAPGEKNVVDDPLAFANEPTAILISKKLAARRKLSTNSPLQLLTSDGVKTFYVRGIVDDSGPAAAFGGQVAIMFIDAAQVSFARGTLVDRIDVALKKGEDISKMTRRISAVVGDFARVERPQQAGERLRALSRPLRNGLQLSGLVALLVGMFIIYNAIGISVAQRRKELGLLRALGVIRTTVVIHLCIEAALLSLPGVLLGLLVAGRLLVYTQGQTLEVVNQVMAAAPVRPIIGLTHIIQGICAGILISICAAFIPARRGAAMDPIAALRPSAVQLAASAIPYKTLGIVGCLFMGLSWAPLYCNVSGGGIMATLLNTVGAALAIPGFIMIFRRLLVVLSERVFGISGRLGLDYVERNLGRSSINVLALMVAVSMSISVGGWLTSFEFSIREWFDQIVAHDLTVTAGSPFADQRHVLFSPNVVDKIATVDGIETIQPSRVVEQQIGDQTITLSAFDSVTAHDHGLHSKNRLKFVEGRPFTDRNEMRNRPLIVLAENAARRLKLKAGDKITLSTPSGRRVFEVRAVVVDYSSEQGGGFIDRQVYVNIWKDTAIDFIELTVKPGADISRVAEQVREKIGGGRGLFVTTTDELRRQFFASVKKGFSYTRSLEIIILVIALLGVMGTMVSAVIDRTREIGMLRAIGSTRTQVTTALMIEAAFLGLCAIVGGMLAGTFQCLLFLHAIAEVEIGWRLSFAFPLEGALNMGVLVIVTSAVAGLLPGLRAARLEIRDALAYE